MSVNNISSPTNNPNETSGEINKLVEKLAKASLPPELSEKAHLMVDRAQSAIKYGGYFAGIEQVSNYIDWITNLPWNNRSEDILDLKKASETLEKNHYGLKQIKDRILEYIAILKLASRDTTSGTITHAIKAPVLFFVGLVGIGKTTLSISIAEAMGRKFIRIPFGGMGSALDLRGQSRVFPDAEPGLIVKALRRAGTKNPVILLDELDRVVDQARADIMGVLLEILDPNQNNSFVDHYLDYPFDLSEVLFIATANNTQNISTAVLDRFEPIRMPSYTDEEKIKICRDYMLPKIIKASGLTPQQLVIADNTWQAIVRPLGFDSGMRSLERALSGICARVARQIVEGQGQNFTITPENVKTFMHTDLNLY